MADEPAATEEMDRLEQEAARTAMRAVHELRAALLMKGTIIDRLARATEHLSAVKREGRMVGTGANFTYATIDQLRAAIRPALAAEGVVMAPHTIEVVRETERPFRQDRVQFDSVLRVVWRFSCSYRPEREEHQIAVPVPMGDLEGIAWLDVPSYGRSLNNSDKDFNTALTYAERNALLSVFHLESGDDPEQQERPEATSGNVSSPRGSSAPREYGREGPPPSKRALPPTDDQRGVATRLRMALAPVHVGGDEGVITWVQGLSRQEHGKPVGDLNRAEFQVIVDAMKEKAAKLVPGYDPETGEVAPPAPPPEAPVPPASEDVQQKIEQAADAAWEESAKGTTRTDPDRQMTPWEEAKALALSAGLAEAEFLFLAMEAGAAAPSDFSDTALQKRFEDKLAERIDELTVNTAPTTEGEA